MPQALPFAGLNGMQVRRSSILRLPHLLIWDGSLVVS